MQPRGGGHAFNGAHAGYKWLWQPTNNDKNQRYLCIGTGYIDCKQNPAKQTVCSSRYREARPVYAFAHGIALTLGPDKASVLPLFHALTGCDSISFFEGRGKKTAWDVWEVFSELTPALKELNALPQEIYYSNSSLVVIERFVLFLYDRTSNLTKVNEAREELFAKKVRTLNNIQPT